MISMKSGLNLGYEATIGFAVDVDCCLSPFVCRVFTCPCRGNSEDLLKVIEAPILVSTFECQLPSNFCCEVFFNRSGFTVRILQTNAIRVIGICEQRGYSSPTFAVILLGFLILALDFRGYVACYVPKSVGFTTEQGRLK